MKKPNASVEPPNTDFDPNDFGQASDLMESVAGNLKGISQGVVIEHDRPERRPPQKENPGCAGRGRAIKVNKNAERS